MTTDEEFSNYLKLLNVYRVVVDVNVGHEKNLRFNRAGVLFAKVCDHVATMIYLLRGTNLPEAGIRFVDSASLNVMARAALECFLTFAYIFALPQNEEEHELRYYAWILSGLADRQDFPTSNPDYKQKLAEEKIQIEDIRKSLQTNSIFLSLSVGQKKQIMEGEWRLGLVDGSWKIISWNKIAVSVDVNETRMKFLYSYLCSYAHSGGLSGIQLQQAMTTGDKFQLTWIAELAIGLVLANMTNLVCELYPRSEVELKKDGESENLVKTYIDFGKTSIYS
jgi:hypothetical protein